MFTVNDNAPSSGCIVTTSSSDLIYYNGNGKVSTYLTTCLLMLNVGDTIKIAGANDGGAPYNYTTVTYIYEL